ncbi:hydroxyacid dehydrogenase [Bacillaceae bacterium SIJ1]|uniref:hydroxyacid dehydrogenase n=1 Tax=Litoribacterium kuwaitense TaxID=1398745 RepID=UPI0013EB24E7|nr:hydroxyacid dehydrogenase [Litoribacterium kuwaitense]NGP44762.1 hydroxyacid dehydrogenase [Litoribacterium kuwaitense]
MKGLYVMNQTSFPNVYPQAVRDKIEAKVKMIAPPLSAEGLLNRPELLREVDVLFSGWGAPVLDRTLLDAAPQLKAFFYAAGSVKRIVTDAVWDRGLIMSSAYAANAVPVAEYALSQILFSLKRGWRFATMIKEEQRFPKKSSIEIPGAYGSTVGIISLSTIGRNVCRLLEPFDVNIVVYDPTVSKDDALALGVELVSLAEVFKRADVVSCHAPLLEATIGLLQREHFSSMKPNATFINTSRGKIVRQEDMLEVLHERHDLTAVLDVTDPEPPEPGAAIFSMPNVIITPHIAGSEARECGRMGEYMLDELKRFQNNEPLYWQVTKESFAKMA